MPFILFFTGCQPGFIDMEAPEVNTVKAGNRFTIRLGEDHRDGYTWQLNADFNHSLVEEMDPVWHGNEKGIYFNFSALAAGTTTLTLIKRKFTDTLTVKSFIVKITSR